MYTERSMFTGIVRAVGRVAERQPWRMAVTLQGLQVAPGDSLAVNGVCLTVASLDGDQATMDLSTETLARTALGDLRPGAAVNLEPALRVGEELGGHFLLGHVDTVGKIATLERKGRDVIIEVGFDPKFGEIIVDKGSVGVDGISLTPFAVREGSFRCAIVPHTWEHTNLRTRRVGDRVNLEFDILGKYVRTWRGR